MEPPEGENKQTPQSPPNDYSPVEQVSTPVPVVSASPAASTSVPSEPPSPTPITAPVGPVAPGNAADQPHTSRANTIILQWLTYAFWGWTVLILSTLTASVFEQLIAGADVSTFLYYVIAGIVVLLPIAFVCDMFYSKNEPAKKVGPSSLVMIVHAVLFAIFAIGSLLFAAWSIVSLATSEGDSSGTIARLCSSLVIALFWAAAFMRAINPPRVSWIPQVYRLTMVGVIVLLIILGLVSSTFDHKTNSRTGSSSSGYGSSGYSSSDYSRDNFDSNGKLDPAVVGGTQCDIGTLNDGSTYAQVAISGNATCTVATSVILGASDKSGKDYTAGGYSCKATKQGGGTEWSSYWNDDFYSYTCSKGSDQVAFNLQTAAQQ